jgi:hypothetical protein
VLRGSHGDVAVVEPDASFAERSMSEHGNRSGTACVHAPSVDIGLGPPSTDRVGTGRSRRSSPRPGEPVTWRRAAWTVAAAVVEQVAEHHRDIAVDSGVSDRDTEFKHPLPAGPRLSSPTRPDQPGFPRPSLHSISGRATKPDGASRNSCEPHGATAPSRSKSASRP